MPTNLPPLSLKRFSLYCSELVIMDKRDRTWVDEPRVLLAWHQLFFTYLAVAAYVNVPGLGFLLESHPLAMLINRIILLVSYLTLIVLHARLAVYHFKYLVVERKDLRISSIAFMWVGWAYLFSLLYRGLYFLHPTLFSYPFPPIAPGPVNAAVGFPTVFVSHAEWFIYSASTTFSIPTPGITSASFLVSAINTTEVLGSTLIVALVIATFGAALLDSKRR
jgi:hypothetical protein